MLAREPVTIYMDDGTYPIARWGVERAAARGVARERLPAPRRRGAARAMIAQDRRRDRRPVVVADGFCPGCGGPAPIADYLRCVEERGGRLVLDDTQALGVLGGADAWRALRAGGGGSLLFQTWRVRTCSSCSSLAKGFGVPIAVLAGRRDDLRRFERQSETRVHSSPPSAALIHAAMRAVQVNATSGDALRARLRHAVASFRRQVATAGVGIRAASSPSRPVDAPWCRQSTALRSPVAVGRPDLLQRSDRPGGRVTLLITARHTAHEIHWRLTPIVSAMGEHLMVNERGGYERTTE